MLERTGVGSSMNTPRRVNFREREGGKISTDASFPKWLQKLDDCVICRLQYLLRLVYNLFYIYAIWIFPSFEGVNSKRKNVCKIFRELFLDETVEGLAIFVWQYDVTRLIIWRVNSRRKNRSKIFKMTGMFQLLIYSLLKLLFFFLSRLHVSREKLTLRAKGEERKRGNINLR